MQKGQDRVRQVVRGRGFLEIQTVVRMSREAPGSTSPCHSHGFPTQQALGSALSTPSMTRRIPPPSAIQTLLSSEKKQGQLAIQFRSTKRSSPLAAQRCRLV